MRISIRALQKTYGRNRVLTDLSLDLRGGEFLSIIGPSGVGKTTLLGILAGIDQADEGSIVREPDESSWEPAIMVFQDFLLFPHLTVLQNIGYGLYNRDNYRRAFGVDELPDRRMRKEAIELRSAELAAHFGLAGMEEKFPAQLSAGQKQRVALARALVIRPALLLLDEPFANLDQNLKMETALFIRGIQREYGVTTLAVTHDLNEAFAMSDRIGVLLDGGIAQLADVETLYRFPADTRIGKFLGPVNILEEESWSLCSFEGAPPEPGSSIMVRAEALEALPDEHGAATVTDRRFQGTLIHLELQLGSQRISAYRLSSAPATGSRVSIGIGEYVVLRTAAAAAAQA
jgi:putative spermidine/putrescine transport system ATP-binding protein